MKLRSDGRGGGYSPLRGLMESVVGAVYRGDWPALAWGMLPASRHVEVVTRKLALPAGSGASCRVAFVSDLHIGPTTPMGVLEAAFAAVERARPDVLLLGGDYVFLDATSPRLAVLAALVSSIRCPVKLAVLGNHDLWTFDEDIRRTLEESGVRVLVNEAVPLPDPWSDVVVLGLDDPWTGLCNPQAAFSQANGEPVRIVLCHSPDGLAGLDGFPFDLFLCGHTHGGQMAAPWGPIVLPYGTMCRQYPGGFGRFGEGLVYVSRGVGTVELPFRTCAPPDVLILDLARADDDEAS